MPGPGVNGRGVRPALPRELLAVRHGQSTANAAFAAAEAAGALSVPITDRDADLPLTRLGRAQSAALGSRLAAAAPDIVYCSPFRRARQTLDEILAALARAGLPEPALRYDERLRDRDTGSFEMRTRAALRLAHPEQIARRERVGPFYFRPPEGENFPDVALRLRSLLRDALPEAAGARLLIVAHDAVVLMLRMILEQLDETVIARLVDAEGVGNCSVTRWELIGGALRLAQFDDTRHLPLDIAARVG